MAYGWRQTDEKTVHRRGAHIAAGLSRIRLGEGIDYQKSKTLGQMSGRPGVGHRRQRRTSTRQ